MAKHRPIFGTILLLGFLLGVHEGRVALWQRGDPAPLRVTQWPADLLPPGDRAELEAGLSLPDRASASARMEDFSS